MSEKVTLDVEGQVLLIGIRRPHKRNAIDVAVLRALAAAYTRLSREDSLWCGVLYGHGDVFTAGLDLASVLPLAVSDGAGAFLDEGQHDPFGNFGPPATKPMIVAAHGLCHTAGLELVLAADLCVAAEGTVFGQMEVRRGIFPFGGATERLPRRIGWGRAMRYILTGDTFDARQAEQWGLVQEVAEPGRHLEAALALATRVTAAAPLAVQAALESARTFLCEDRTAGLTHIQETGRRIATTPDAQEGMLSLMEKREPVFRGER